ncbi:MAG: helix-turn-helix domain-containing protein [Candidatus Doudnabacteria bacterium]|nr:helix-turn-helix domain-containing protein [Candidatus Doudnabacteria bacterium]
MANHANQFVFFQTKKVKLETLPEYLRAVREEHQFLQEEAAAKAGLSVKVLKSLEEGLFENLPASVYVAGFLAKLAHVYKVDKQALIDQVEIERKIFKNVKLADKRPIRQAFEFVITPKNFSLASAIVFAGVTVAYVIWQVLAIGQVPLLEITAPENLAIIEKSNVGIVGRTDPGANVSVNNQPVFVDSEGKFTSNISLSPGLKELVVVAENRFKKSTRKSLSVISQSKTATDSQINLQLKLDFMANLEISYRIDGREEIHEFPKQGDSRLLEAKKLILLSASDAGGIKAEINGQSLGFLGRTGEKLTDIPFSAESGTIK